MDMQHMWEKYDTQSQQNAIQHACKHFTQTKNKETTNWKQKNQKMKIYYIRKNAILILNTTNNNAPIMNLPEKQQHKNKNNQEQSQFWEK